MPDQVEDRRSVIETAFTDMEEETIPVVEPASPPTSQPEGDVTHEEQPSPEPTEKPAVVAKTSAKPEGPGPTEAPAPESNVEKAPQSWRAPQREKWAKLDPDVRQEIMRRERETTKVLGETAQARQFHNQFMEVVAPFAARIQSQGINAITAVHELLKADYLLSSSPKAQRAQYMARLIKEYDVDILELDSALAGTGKPADPVNAKVEELLQQRLAPFQQYLQGQQQREQAAERQSSEQINTTIEQMASDPKYPHFETVRAEMADVIELSAKRGRFLSLDQAYNQAVQLNPEVSVQVANQRQADAKKNAAKDANARAQRALSASVSVGGAPYGAPNGASDVTDRRATIAAAFDSLPGR